MRRHKLLLALPWLIALLAILFGGNALRPNVSASHQGIYDNIQLFNEVLNLVSEYYVESIESDSLIQGAIGGMLDQLDPHSNYIHPKRFEEMDERNRGTYQGIGVSFAIRDGHLTVISPMEGGPSDRLGIRAGDIITHIEGESAFQIKENEVFEKLRGPKGTRVQVTVRRAGRKEPLEFEIVRDEIPIESVPYAFMLEPGTGYVRMRNFSARTSDELEAALQQLEAEGLERLVLDLRGNSGGYLNAAVEVTDKFIEAGKKIVYTKGRIRGSSDDYFATDAATHPRLPLVILINAGSASASEIVSGAVQDWDRGLVVGQQSFGKGLVQRQYRLRNGGALLLTVARYYTPSGRLIQRPYEPDGREAYYRELADRFAEDDSSTAEPDSGEVPIYHTLLQERPVTGGGGIWPDVIIEASYHPSQLNTDLMLERKYFDYVNRYLSDEADRLPTEFPAFLAEFQVTDAMLDDFRALLEADSFAFEPETLATHRDEVARGIRSEMARFLWGENMRYRVLVAADPAVQRAVELLPEASAMLAESERIEAKRAAAE
ncbi:MAG: PDZ domain-containing protein [Candidatus Eisenbacteria bacterium]|nr:PDZ domain-containing protein [Candidatus Eisenbacteria bacterium]